MKVLITGGEGQLAFAVRDRMSGEHEVVSRSRRDLDVTSDQDVLDVVRTVGPDVIVNGAAYNNVDAAEDTPVPALAVNAFAVRSLARAAEAVNAILVHYSTDFVFDGTATEPYAETAPPNPRSAYATSKLLGEWFAEHRVQHYVLRVESLYGGGAQSRPDASTRGSSLDRIADAMLSGQDVRAFEDRVVSPSFVPDVAETTLSLLENAAPYGLYHCVGEGHGTWVDVAEELARQLRSEVGIDRVRMADLQLKAARPLFCALSNARLVAVGVTPPTWQDAVARYAEARLAAPAAGSGH